MAVFCKRPEGRKLRGLVLTASRQLTLALSNNPYNCHCPDVETGAVESM